MPTAISPFIEREEIKEYFFQHGSSVVAIPGSAEDANETWTHTSTGTNRLKDLLPVTSERALRPRISSYSYGADVEMLPASDGGNNILQHAYTFIARLQSERNLTDISKRPLVFICDGLGGILLKRALAYSATQVYNKVPHCYSIYVSTFGILFLGSTHNSFEIAALRSLNQAQYGAGELESIVKH